MIADHGRADEASGRPPRPRRTMLADPAYTSEVNGGHGWLWPLFELDFDSTHKLTSFQRVQPARPAQDLRAADVPDPHERAPLLAAPPAAARRRPPPPAATGSGHDEAPPNPSPGPAGRCRSCGPDHRSALRLTDG
jgi:hypothetical protein